MKWVRPLEWVALATVLLVIVAILFPVFPDGDPLPAGTKCLLNAKGSSLALVMYANDFDDRLPPRDLWMDATLPYTKTESVWHCPSVPKAAYGYAFNGALSRAKTPLEPQTVPLIYDFVNPIRNASDLLASLPLMGRHRGRNTVGYADGHAMSVPARPVVH